MVGHKIDMNLQAGRKIGEWYIAEAMFSTTTVVRTAQDMSRYIYISVKVLEGEGLGRELGQGRLVYKQPGNEEDGSCHS
jgi:hypothetical protein